MKILTLPKKICPVCKKDHWNKLFCSGNCLHSKEGSRILQQIKEINSLKKYGVKNPSQLQSVKDKKKKTSLEHYGVENPSQAKEVIEKRIQTFINHFGFDNPNKCSQIIEKRKQTNLEKYGVENPQQSIDIQNKTKQTNLQKYGTLCALQSTEVKKKTKQTNLKKYGVENPNQNKNVRNKIEKTCLEKYGVNHPLKSNIVKNKSKQTCLEKYGVEYSLQSERVKAKSKQTCLEKYGEECTASVSIIRNKMSKSRMAHHYVNHILNFKIVKPLFSLEEYQGNKHVYKWQCIKCNNSFEGHNINGCIPRCLICNPPTPGSSIPEREIQEWLEQHIPIERNKRYYENGKYKYELDIFIPSKNIGIEYDDLYTHSEISGGKHPTYHLDKSEYFLNKGIQVIHIFGNEWHKKKDVVKSILFSYINKLNNVDIEQCVLKEISHKDLHEFLFKNYIYNFDKNSKINYGLYYHNELIYVMAFKSKNKTRWQLIYQCNKIGFNVKNGFSKCLNHFLENIQNSINYYSNRRYIEDIQKLKLIGKILPNFNYIKNGETYSSSNFKKCKLAKKLGIFDPKLTEWENMQINGFDRIWDCGNYIYALETVKVPADTIIL